MTGKTKKREDSAPATEADADGALDLIKPEGFCE